MSPAPNTVINPGLCFSLPAAFHVPCSGCLMESSNVISRERKVSAPSWNNQLAFPFCLVLPPLSQEFLFWLRQLPLFGMESCSVSQMGLWTDLSGGEFVPCSAKKGSHWDFCSNVRRAQTAWPGCPRFRLPLSCVFSRSPERIHWEARAEEGYSCTT